MGQVFSSVLRFLFGCWKPERSKGSIDHHIGYQVDDDQNQSQSQLILPVQLQHIHMIVDYPDPPPHVDGPSSDHNPTTTLTHRVIPFYNITKTQRAISDHVTTSERVLVTKRIGPYTSSQKILLVGEGDFSFSACLAVAFGSANNMIATSLNTEGFLLKNYANFKANRKKLVTWGCIVLHGIDATQMATHPELSHMKFDRVVFNFPHSGFRSKETPNIELGRHQRLVSGFLRNAKKMIVEDGQIHIRHKCNDNFLKWNIPKLAADQGLFLIQEAKFKLSKFPGYHTKCGFGGDKDFECHPSKTYMFGLTG